MPFPSASTRWAAGFSEKLIAGLLREELGFDGQVVTDWNITRGMPWGVEDQPLEERIRRIVACGHDQLGGETESEVLLGLVAAGAVSAARLDESARRVLTPMFQMGLFENPYVDAERAGEVVGGPRATAAGRAATQRSLTLLKNEGGLLPLQARPEGVRREPGGRGGGETGRRWSPRPSRPMSPIIAVEAPLRGDARPDLLYPHGPGGGRGRRRARRGGPLRHEGTLAYEGATNAAELAAIQRLAASGAPVVVVIHLDRPAVLSEFLGEVAAVVGALWGRRCRHRGGARRRGAARGQAALQPAAQHGRRARPKGRHRP